MILRYRVLGLVLGLALVSLFAAHTLLAKEPAAKSATTRPAEAASADALAPFDPDPRHLWNRLYGVLLVRTTPDGRRVADDLFPYLWANTRCLLQAPAHESALRVLDEFLETHGEKLIADPQKRLLLQRDLWAVFDWCAPKAEEAAAVALRGRLAKAISRLALSPREIAALPDNYRAAVRAHAFPSEYDRARREQAYFPPDLLDADGPWLCLDLDAGRQEHAEAVRGRSVFLVFVRLPDGKRPTVEQLKAATDRGHRLPAGTRMALLRRALAVDDTGSVVATPVTESLQVRVLRDTRRWEDSQDSYEFNLDRRAWFGGGHGLRALTADDRSLTFEGHDYLDPFETPARKYEEGGRFYHSIVGAPTLKSCSGCHQPEGAFGGLASVRTSLNARGPEADAFTSPEKATKQAVLSKARSEDWESFERSTSDIPEQSLVTEAPVHPADHLGKVLKFWKNRDAAGRVEHLLGVRLFDEQGNLIREVPYVNDKQEGTERAWHADGTAASARPYHAGLLDGECKQWDGAGRLLGSFHMRAGTGVLREWTEDGKLLKEGFYRDGKKHGVQREWYEDGALERDEAFEDGQLQGASRLYSRNGQMLQEMHYWGGRSHGPLYLWDEGGHFKDGTPQFYVDGKRVLRRDYDRACREDPRLPPHPSDWPDGETVLPEDPFLVRPPNLTGSGARY